MAAITRSPDFFRRCPLADNPVPAKSLSATRVSEIIATVTNVIAEIERFIAGSGVRGALEVGQIGQLSALFGNLAGVAIKAAHEVFGKPITPDSVLALMPAQTPLVDPPDESTPGA